MLGQPSRRVLDHIFLHFWIQWKQCNHISINGGEFKSLMRMSNMNFFLIIQPFLPLICSTCHILNMGEKGFSEIWENVTTKTVLFTQGGWRVNCGNDNVTFWEISILWRCSRGWSLIDPSWFFTHCIAPTAYISPNTIAPTFYCTLIKLLPTRFHPHSIAPITVCTHLWWHPPTITPTKLHLHSMAPTHNYTH